MTKNNLEINPQTKVLKLIETYPELEEVLIKFVPAFKKLKNPILRKTVAKIATLKQAASIGNVKLEDLLNLLRKETGQELVKNEADITYDSDKPKWFNESLIKQELDIREMLEAGEQPISKVVLDLNKMEKQTIYKLTAPFLPAPLIDKATNLNMQHWVVKENENLVFVYFYKD